MDIFEVEISKKAEKDLRKVPQYIVLKLAAWIDSVGLDGLQHTRKIPGYHDEPLRGKRQGERSIRLSKHYRAIYIVGKNQRIEFVEIIEVNKHEY